MSLRTALAHILALFSKKRRAQLAEIERVKTVVSMIEATRERELSCEEAYRLLDQYAEAVRRGDDPAVFFPDVRHHLEVCMECREELEALLIALDV